MSVLVVDVGTSSVRAGIVDARGTVAHVHQQLVLPTTPAPGLVEFDAVAIATAVRATATDALAAGGPVRAVGIANQRASTIVWDRASGEPVGPGLGWQDLRTIGECLTLNAQGFALAPNQSATKIAWLLDQADPERERDLCFGTVDTWVAWTLSAGQFHVTDPTNAGLTGLLTGAGDTWDTRVLETLQIPASMLPDVVDSIGEVGPLKVLEGAPVLAGIAGDQQASLIGQGCVERGQTKITFGTGGMLDVCGGDDRPRFATRGTGGTFPIVARSVDHELTWGLEAIMLAAGSNIEWLRDDLGVIDTAADSDGVAASCDTTDGVVYVPALLGLGTPWWDYGARGTLLGVTRGTGRAEVVRAVLEGIAHRGADLVEAAETDMGTDGSLSIDTLRVDGGMSANATFIQALADATARPIEVSPELEATTVGAAYLAGIATGVWGGTDETAALFRPRVVVEPATSTDRDRWRSAVERARGWYPELSALDF
ncbi:MAG TPA: FGGY family carbohydrate kinase [Acidimicrobiales bacterium]|nr:FGGY family carbohydrate kinase [Acidimicrobiales bacterium]